MKERKNSPDTAELRRREEDRLKALPETPLSETPHSDTQHLIHELQVQQIELAMQKEELLQSRAILETVVEQYTDFYDFASVGYFTLARDRTIRRANLTGARLLGVERGRLMGRRFALFVSDSDRPTWNAFIEKVFENRVPENCEVPLHKEGHAPLWVHIEATASEDGQECRTVVVDITERRQAQDALRKAHERWHITFDAMLDPVALLSADGTVEQCNRAFAAFLGRDPGAVTGQKCYRLVHQSDSHIPGCPLVRAQHSGVRETMELPVGDQTFLVTTDPVQSPDGQVSGFVHIMHDITEHKRMEKALLEFASRQQSLLSAIPDIIMEVDSNKVYTWANEPGINFFGEDVIGREAADYFEGEQNTYDAVKPLFNGDENVIYLEGWQRNKHGAKRLLAWWCRVLKDQHGNVTGALSSARDITERKRAEEALQRSELLLRQTQQITKAGGWEYDVEKGKLSWTHEVYRIYGVSPDEYDPNDMARNIAFYEDRAAIETAFSRAVELGEPYDLELKFRNVRGESLWVRTIGKAEIKDSKVVRVCGNFMDITDRKQVEHQLTEQLEELRRWHQATLDREMRILDLKRVVNELLVRAGQPPRYARTEEDQ